jgi:hypothetical protein
VKATIRDSDAIRIIRPVDVTAYLRQAGGRNRNRTEAGPFGPATILRCSFH